MKHVWCEELLRVRAAQVQDTSSPLLPSQACYSQQPLLNGGTLREALPCLPWRRLVGQGAGRQ